VQARFFAAAHPGGVVRSVQALDAADVVLAERSVRDQSALTCA
jgi:hypothetical protein